MRTLLLLSLLLFFVLPSQAQNELSSDEESLVIILGFNWSKNSRTNGKQEPSIIPPVREVIPANKNLERNRRVNDPVGAIDPNTNTLDGRSAALEKNVQESRKSIPKSTDIFAYQVKVRNASKKTIEIVFWEYQFKELANPATTARRQFLCGVKIKPDKEKELQSFSLSRPSDVISVESLTNKSEKLYEEKVVINRVEYTDGTIWQRKDWNFAEIRSALARAIGTPWGAEMCREL